MADLPKDLPGELPVRLPGHRPPDAALTLSQARAHLGWRLDNYGRVFDAEGNVVALWRSPMEEELPGGGWTVDKSGAYWTAQRGAEVVELFTPGRK